MKPSTIFQILFFVILVSKPKACLCQTSNSLSEQATNAFNNKEYTKATILFNKLIISEPKNVIYYQRRAFCYFQNEKWEKAIADCDKGILLDNSINNRNYLYNLKGNCYYYLRKWEKALENYNYSLDYEYENISVNKIKSEVLYNLDRYEESIKICNFLLNFKSLVQPNKNEKFDIYILLAYNYIAIDSLIAAKKYYGLAHNLDSTNVTTDYLNALILYTESDYEKATKIYTKIISQDSMQYDALYFRAQSHYYAEKYDLAILDFQASKKNFSKNPQLYYMLGNSEYNNKDYNLALQNYFIAIKLNPKSSQYYNEIGWTYFLLKKYKEGLVYVNKAIELDKNNYNALDTRGCINYKLSDFTRSIADFNAAIKLEANSYNSYYYRGLAYLKTNSKTKACLDWEFLSSQKDYSSPENEIEINQLLIQNCK